MVYATTDIEKKLWQQGYKLICGVDEVGRGCFAGPVVAGAVVFSAGCKIPKGLADSKLLKPVQRQELAEQVKKCASAWAVGLIDVATINQIGIGKATQQAFLKAVQNLTSPPNFILIDAFYIDAIDRRYQQPIKSGDKLSVSIAAASIVAKVYRDDLMTQSDEDFPEYGFGVHKGYGTKKHQEAIKQFGLCDLHRRSFNLDKFL